MFNVESLIIWSAIAVMFAGLAGLLLYAEKKTGEALYFHPNKDGVLQEDPMRTAGFFRLPWLYDDRGIAANLKPGGIVVEVIDANDILCFYRVKQISDGKILMEDPFRERMVICRNEKTVTEKSLCNNGDIKIRTYSLKEWRNKRGMRWRNTGLFMRQEIWETVKSPMEDDGDCYRKCIKALKQHILWDDQTKQEFLAMRENQEEQAGLPVQNDGKLLQNDIQKLEKKVQKITNDSCASQLRKILTILQNVEDAANTDAAVMDDPSIRRLFRIYLPELDNVIAKYLEVSASLYDSEERRKAKADAEKFFSETADIFESTLNQYLSKKSQDAALGLRTDISAMRSVYAIKGENIADGYQSACAKTKTGDRSLVTQ